jgi:hypothetical protein
MAARPSPGTRLESVRRYHHHSGERFDLRTPAADPRLHGLLLAFGVGPSFLLGAPVVGFVIGGDVAFFAAWGLGALLGTALVGAGLLLALGALSTSRDFACRIDLADRVIRRPGRAPELLRTPEAVIYRGRSIALRHADGRREELLRLWPLHDREAARRAAAALGAALGVPAE